MILKFIIIIITIVILRYCCNFNFILIVSSIYLFLKDEITYCKRDHGELYSPKARIIYTGYV